MQRFKRLYRKLYVSILRMTRIMRLIWRLTKMGTAIALFWGASFYYSSWFLAFNQSVQIQAAEAKEQVTASLASALGFVKPEEPVEPLTPDEYLSHRELAEREALRLNVPPIYVRALMRVESNEYQHARSSVGAIGLMQVMPDNARICGITVQELKNDRKKNIICGIKIFKSGLDFHGGNLLYALWEYNGGRGAVSVLKKCGEINDKCLGGYTQSRDHAHKVFKEMTKDI